MKRIIIFSAIILLIFMFSATVSADDNGDSSVHITVVISEPPESVIETPAQPPSATDMPAQKPTINIYPVNVTETVKNGRREIVKTYELSPSEKPKDIPRGSFERDGYIYEIADITKKDNVRTEQKNHTETVKLNSDTKDFDKVLNLLPTTQEYKNDGFTGTLTLDVGSITVEQAGTRSVAYTVSESREYPHLSSNDSSFVPKTITDRYGRTLTLSSISWRTQSSTAIDYHSIPDSYAASATYTGTAYRTVITGYEVTAQYSGTIGKTVTGKTVYTALFIGTQIIPPTVETTTAEITEIPTQIESITAVETKEATMETTTEPESETAAEVETTVEMPTLFTEKEPINLILIIIIIILTAGLLGCYFYYKRKIAGGNELNETNN